MLVFKNQLTKLGMQHYILEKIEIRVSWSVMKMTKNTSQKKSKIQKPSFRKNFNFSSPPSQLGLVLLVSFIICCIVMSLTSKTFFRVLM